MVDIKKLIMLGHFRSVFINNWPTLFLEAFADTKKKTVIQHWQGILHG